MRIARKCPSQISHFNPWHREEETKIKDKQRHTKTHMFNKNTTTVKQPALPSWVEVENIEMTLRTLS